MRLCSQLAGVSELSDLLFPSQVRTLCPRPVSGVLNCNADARYLRPKCEGLEWPGICDSPDLLRNACRYQRLLCACYPEIFVEEAPAMLLEIACSRLVRHETSPYDLAFTVPACKPNCLCSGFFYDQFPKIKYGLPHPYCS